MLSWLSTAFSAVTGFVSSSGWIKWVGIGIAVLAIGIYVGLLKYDNAQKDVAIERLASNVAKLETANQAKDATIKSLEAASAAHAQAEAQWLRDKAESDMRHEEERRQWKEALHNDPETRAWADSPLPGFVRGRLQQQAAD